MLSFFAFFSISYRLPETESFVSSDIPEQYFDQKKDHFDAGSAATFRQMYYEVQLNATVSPTVKAVILKIGAESDNLNPAGIGDFYSVLAKRFHANVLTIQHRYFGKSIPENDTSVENLKFLTVEQAVEDYASFHKYYTDKTGLNVPWLIIGGSYPGMLSAITRAAHPELFKAAISSSGVLYADNDFQDFDLQDAISMGQECAQVAKQARIKIEKLLETDRDWVYKQFGVKDKYTFTNDGQFMNFIGEVFTLGLQYNEASQLCGPLVDAHRTGRDIVMELAHYTRGWFATNKGIPDTYTTAYLNDTKVESLAPRAWFWMTCNQLAYWQTGGGRLSLRGNKVTKEVFEDQCKDVFGIEMHPDVDAFNAKYSKTALETDHIFYTTASQDPWTWTCVTQDTPIHPNSAAITYAGKELGHCSDLHAATENDPADLVRTRAIVANTVEQWLFANPPIEL